MLPTAVSLDLDRIHVINFKIFYTNNHLGWIQFIENKIKTKLKFVHIYEDRLFVFIDPDKFDQANRQWHYYLKSRRYRTMYHVRLIKFSQNLSQLIKNWYVNIKELKIDIESIGSSYQITITAPKNLRQFVIGKNGVEIEMLASFLDKCIAGKQNYQLKIC
ncbi:hypothetical protein [Candidatus Lokiarchaeum ossiferum]|uniref:hypothetical protein n=1 Tax=Candidatus Lokiarchaeum ossiferum TaxID=2951803 RepID=UPI00352DCC1E